MTEPQPGRGLQTIFAIFLGLMVTAFIGVGVYTFYPSPAEPFRTRTVALSRQEQAIRTAKEPDALTPADREQLQRINAEQAQLEDASREADRRWGRTTSVILVAFATISMAVSLLRAMQLPVISNGLLLGGVFTMIYGVGWIIVTDTSVSRFLVLTTALAITLGLGYVRFVRGRDTTAIIPRDAPVVTADTSALEERVRRLEQRLDDAARALGRDDRPRSHET